MSDDIRQTVFFPPANAAPVRRWWQFWIAKPRHHIMNAETGKFFDVPAPQSYLGWLFSWDTWFKVRP